MTRRREAAGGVATPVARKVLCACPGGENSLARSGHCGSGLRPAGVQGVRGLGVRLFRQMHQPTVVFCLVKQRFLHKVARFMVKFTSKGFFSEKFARRSSLVARTLLTIYSVSYMDPIKLAERV